MSSPLYTGITSKSIKVQEQRHAVKVAKNEIRKAVFPGHKQLLKDLDAEIAKMSDISTIVDGTYVADDEMRFELAARKRYVNLMRRLKTKYEKAIADES